MRNLRPLATVLVLAAASQFAACSGAKEDEEQLAVEGDEAEAQGSAANEVAAAEPTPAPEPEPVKVSEPTPEPTPAPAALTNDAAVDKNRVVRFVSGDQTAIAAEPKDGAAVVGKLVKGDRVLVVEQNGWGKIAEGMYVNLKNLTNKGVAPDRQPAQWTKPAH